MEGKNRFFPVSYKNEIDYSKIDWLRIESVILEQTDEKQLDRV